MIGFHESYHAGISALKFKAVSLLLSLKGSQILTNTSQRAGFRDESRKAEVFREFLRKLELKPSVLAMLDVCLKKNGFNLFFLQTG
jgi:hypothetical protein